MNRRLSGYERAFKCRQLKNFVALEIHGHITLLRSFTNIFRLNTTNLLGPPDLLVVSKEPQRGVNVGGSKNKMMLIAPEERNIKYVLQA